MRWIPSGTMTSELSCQPARVLHQYDAELRASTNRLRKVLQGNAQDLDIDRGQQEPLALSRFGADKSIHVEPFIPLLYTKVHPESPNETLPKKLPALHPGTL
jgi:hypothetical protein